MTTLRSLPRAVWLVTAVHVLLLGAYSVLLPTWRAPDEPHHVDLVLRMADTQPYPAWDEANISRSVTDTLDDVHYFDGSHHLEADAAPPRAQRPLFDAALAELDSTAPNQLAQHPPAYYAGMGAILGVTQQVLPGDATFDATVGGLRLLNAFLLAVASPCAFLIARRLGGSRSAGLTAAMVPLAVPQWAAIGGSVNNDNLQTAQLALLAVLVAHIATGDLSRRTAVAAGVVAGAGLWVKAFGFLGPIWLVMAYAVAARTGSYITRPGEKRGTAGREDLDANEPSEGTHKRSDERPRTLVERSAAAVSLLRLTQAGVVTALVGCWWWARNLLVEGKLQPSLLLLPDAPDGFEPDPWWWLQRFVPWMARRFWGWFGWFDVKMPGPVVFIASAIVLGLAILGVMSARRRGAAAVLFGGFVVLLAATAQFAWGGYASSGATPSIQGRYVFPAVPALAALVALGMQRMLAARQRIAPLLLWISAGFLHAVALAVLVPWYWGATDADVVERVRALGAWSPWPGPATIGLLTLSLVLWMLLGAWCLRAARSVSTERRDLARPVTS